MHKDEFLIHSQRTNDLNIRQAHPTCQNSFECRDDITFYKSSASNQVIKTKSYMHCRASWPPLKPRYESCFHHFLF